MAPESLPRPDIVVCSDARTLAVDAAHRFTALNAVAVRLGFPFNVALAGGRTPALLYSLLTVPPFRDAIDWSRTRLFLGDERCVAPDSQFSNFRMIRETLLDPLGYQAQDLVRIHGEDPDCNAAAVAYAADLARSFGSSIPRFDLVLLGMGPDGHCASLFPRKPSLRERSRWAIASEPGLEPFVPRVTLTLPVLNNAANVLFLVAGRDKAAALARVLNGPAAPDDLPSQSVQPANGTLTWLLDRAAATMMSR